MEFNGNWALPSLEARTGDIHLTYFCLGRNIKLDVCLPFLLPERVLHRIL